MSKKKICVVTTTRAEYGVLKNIINRIDMDHDLELYLVVTGAHLNKEYGYTIQEILEDRVHISEVIEYLNERNDEIGITEAMGRATIAFGKLFWRVRPAMLVVLGDRYELLPICQCALICGIPISHISGGELTEGAIDDAVRHAITKMSYLHFPGCEVYRQRIIQMGEEPDRVFNYGDVGVENINKMQFMSKVELEKELGVSLEKPYACVTYHPVTLTKQTAKGQIEELLGTLKEIDDMQFIITKANADVEGKVINDYIDEFVENARNCVCFASLGIKRYLSLMKESEFVIGNSSSGIIEAPSLKIPTINIGERQRGRLQAESILNCEPKKNEILKAIKKARSIEFKDLIKDVRNPYGGGETSKYIVEEIKRFTSRDGKMVKHFFDLM